MSGRRQPSQEALLEGAIRTIEDVLVPELQTNWARSSALGLVGQLRYAVTRAASDSLAAQDAELEGCLASLLDEFQELRDVVAACEPTGNPSWDLRERAGRLLVFALDDDGPAAVAVRNRLRPVVTEHVTQDLTETTPMFHAFLASGSLGSTG